MTISRVTAQWTGFNGAPGYTNFYFRDLADSDQAFLARNQVSAFFNSIKTYLPSVVSVTTQNPIDVIDEATGQIVGFGPSSETVPIVVGGSTRGYSGASGAVVSWETDGVRNGRRVRGRTFLVPLSSSAYDESGTLTAEVQTAIQDAATGLVTDTSVLEMLVWSRPKAGSGGEAHVITSARVPDMAAILRSRRD